MKRNLAWGVAVTLVLSFSATYLTGCSKTAAVKKEAVVTREAKPAEEPLVKAETEDPASREKALREQALREQALREQTLREQTLREQTLKEKPTNEAEARAAREAAEKARREAEARAAVILKELQIPDIYFEFDRFNLKPEAQKILKEGAHAFLKHKEYKLTVEGHADERGTVEYNLALGDKRSSEVTKYLVALGIEKERIKTISYGKEKPEDRGHDEAAWAKNRRVHFVVIPPSKN